MSAISPRPHLVLFSNHPLGGGRFASRGYSKPFAEVGVRNPKGYLPKAHPLQRSLASKEAVRVAGLEPTASGSPNQRSTRLSYTLIVELSRRRIRDLFGGLPTDVD